MDLLHLQLTVDERHVVECASALHERLPPGQWRLLVQLAAELVARQEATAAGTRMLVVPATVEQAEQLAADWVAGRR